MSTAVDAQSNIEWEVVGGGTELSSGGAYTMQGTVGQASTAQAQGGQYSLVAGFWSWILAVATPGAPALLVSWDESLARMRISWPITANGWVLQSTDALAGPETQWLSLEGPYDTTDTEQEWSVTPLPGQRYYRLQKASVP